MKTVWAAGCALLMIGEVFSAQPPEDVTTLYGFWSRSQGLYRTTTVWSTDDTGSDKKGWTQGSYGIVKDYWAINNSLSMYESFTFWGLCFDKAPNNWATFSAVMKMGAGGFALPNGGKFGVGDEKGKYVLELTADQTWSGGTTATSGLSVGYEVYNNYYKTGARANGCTKLTLTGKLNTIFTWTNDFSTTDIRVEAPATLNLAKRWQSDSKQRDGQPELHAKSLTLSGDGSSLQAGGTFSSPFGLTVTRETRLDANTVAPVMTLENGADLTGTSGVLDIEMLNVTGGTSELLGSWTLQGDLSAVISAGATLALSGSVKGTSALNASGEGSLKLKLDSFGLTGPLTLSEDTSLIVESTAKDFRQPFVGGKKLTIAYTGSGIMVVSDKALSGFTGKEIEISAGQVHFDSVPDGVVVTTSGTGVSVETPPTLYGNWSEKNKITWTNAAGEVVSWIRNARAEITSVNTSNADFSYNPFYMYGIQFDTPTQTGFWLSKGTFHIGAGGITFTRAGMFGLGLSNWGSPLLNIDDDQTWRGPGSGTAYATLHVGWMGYSNYGYHKMSLGVDPSVEKLTMCGLLRTYFSTTNDLSHVDVRVEAPAQLVLADTWYCTKAIVGDTHLRARTLTLSGDGDGMLPLGKGDLPYPTSVTSLRSIATLDADYVAGALTLEDGADLTASSPVRFGLPGLTAKGTGESVLSGTFTFLRPTVALTLVDGAALYLAGTFRETAKGTALSATGSGTLKISPAGYGLTGGLTLGADVTLAVVGKGQLSVPVTGGKEATFDAGDAALFVPAAALAQFTGDTVTVSSGTVVFEALPEGVSVVEAGGKALRVTDASDGMVVTDAVRAEGELTVGEGETLYICGNGLTKATHVTLAGGTLAFCRTATVGSDVFGALTVPAKTFVRTEAADIVGTLAGFVAATNDVAANVRTFAVAGAGTVDFTGGADFKRVQFFVTGGSANLRTAGYQFWQQHWGVKGGQYLGIRDGAQVDAPWPSESGTYGLYSEPSAGCTSVVEICENSSVTLNQSVTMYLGLWKDAVARGILRLNGGSLTVSHGAGLGIGYPDGARGIFELRGGLFNTDQPFRSFNDASAGVVDWTGGTVKLGPDFFKYAGTSPSVRYFDGNGKNLSVRIGGPTCVLDLSKAPAFTNVAARAENEGSWTWTEGGRLTVTNGGTFVMNRFPTNGCVVVKDCSLEIADDTVPPIGEIGFAGTSADDRIVGTVDGLVAQAIRFARGGLAHPSQVVNIGWSDFAFDDGAFVLVSPAADGTVTSLAVPGKVTFDGGAVCLLERNGNRLSAGAGSVLTAVGGIVGDPVFAPAPRTPKGLSLSVSGGSVDYSYEPPGLMVIVR